MGVLDNVRVKLDDGKGPSSDDSLADVLYQELTALTYDDEEPGFLFASAQCFGIPCHVQLFRVEQTMLESGGIANQEPHASLLEHRSEQLTDMWVAIDGGGGGPWRLVQIPGREGDWWPTITPHQH